MEKKHGTVIGEETRISTGGDGIAGNHSPQKKKTVCEIDIKNGEIFLFAEKNNSEIYIELWLKCLPKREENSYP